MPYVYSLLWAYQMSPPFMREFHLSLVPSLRDLQRMRRTILDEIEFLFPGTLPLTQDIFIAGTGLLRAWLELM